jgi:hypothetical protein
MSNESTKKMIRLYNQTAPATMFLSGMFQSPPENFHNSETVELDVERDDEDVAVVIQDLTTGYRFNSTDIYTNKEFKPPVFKEAFALQSTDLLKRDGGVDPFADARFQSKATLRAFKAFRKLEKKIRRAIEQQCAQILTTGTVTLTDKNGTALFTLSFSPKVAHFPTAATAWDAANPTIAADLLSLDNTIRNNGLNDPDMKIMGELSFEAAMEDSDFRARFDTRRADLGSIGPMKKVGNGGIFRGIVDIGNYRSEVWTYNGRYKDPQTSVKVKYVPDDKVISRFSDGRLDLTFGRIPRFVPPDARVMKYLPRRISNSRGRMDLFTNVWVTADGETLMGGLGSRPLAIATAIDTFGCLDTGI